jgi:hypothetical protein
MEISEEIIEKIANEAMRELEEARTKAGEHITFDDIEMKMLEVRHKIGEIMMQKSVEAQASIKMHKKKLSIL